MDKLLKDYSSDIVYYVDYIWDEDNVDPNVILELAEMNDYIGTDFDRPLVYLKNISVSSNNFKVMKSNTLKYTLPNKIDIIKFNGTEEEIKKFSQDNIIKINAVCKPVKNEWGFNINPQLELVDYEESEITGWDF